MVSHKLRCNRKPIERISETHLKFTESERICEKQINNITTNIDCHWHTFTRIVTNHCDCSEYATMHLQLTTSSRATNSTRSA